MANQTAVLTEIERQQRYLDDLPDGFQFPLFNYKVALESQRKSAYKTTAAAAREIVDNSIEAGASQIDVVFRQGKSKSGHRLVDAIAFIDDGPGMLRKMIRYALCWGGGTHHDEPAPNHIGRFGFGLPNSSINQTRLVEVYSRTAAEEPIYKSWLNLDEFTDFGAESVPRPEEDNLPEFVQRHLKRNGREFDHGTIVVWLNPDRLSYKRAARLKEHLVEDFGVVYRYFLLNPNLPLRLMVEGVEVRPVHPLFAEPEALLYEPPSADVEAANGGGARRVGEWYIPVKYSVDGDTGEQRLRKLEDEEAINDSDGAIQAAGTVHVCIYRMPLDFVRGERGDNKKYPEAYRRHEIRKSRRGMSFVRANREIETLDVFPKSGRDKAQGMGDWPELQSYASSWGLEVKFNPNLDDIFGITNDKQGVRPIEEFWRILADEGIDAAAHRENGWQQARRAERRKQTAKEKGRSRNPEIASPAEASAQDADVASSDRPGIPEQHKQSAKKNIEEKTEERAEKHRESIEEARRGLQKSLKNRTYKIELFESPHGPFFEPVWVGDTVFVRVNTLHSFYRVLYQDLLELSGGARVKEAIDALLLTLGRSELTVIEPEMAEWYRVQRERKWSTHLEDALRSLTQRLSEDREEESMIDSETG